MFTYFIRITVILTFLAFSAMILSAVINVEFVFFAVAM